MLLGVTILLSAVATIAKAYRLAEIGHYAQYAIMNSKLGRWGWKVHRY